MFSRLISIAPMMNYTDRHARYFFRLISPHALLYTEMITTKAILMSCDREKILGYHPLEHPLSLQLGGNNPKELALCARVGETLGYDEINLNVGCPSNRVKTGQFGACLMLNPQLVADCVGEMKNAVKIPITVKCRIGIDHIDAYDDLVNFIKIVSKAGCFVFIIHARKAWLKGLSPKENRTIPPLEYEKVRRLKNDFPTLTFIMNGGIKTTAEIKEHLTYVDGVMIGREAYANPYWLTEIEKRIFF